MTTSKKILILTHEFAPFHGGIATYTKEIALAAHLAGHEVTLLAPDYGKESRVADQSDYPFRVVRYRGGMFELSLLSFFRVVRNTWRWAAPSEYDIIHAIDGVHIKALNFINHFKTCPFIATAYGTEILAHPSRKLRLLAVEPLFKKAEKILAISHFTKSLLIEKFPLVDQSKIQVTHLAANDYWFEQVLDEKEVRAKYKIPQEHKLLLTVARVDERKGHHLVLEALKGLPSALKKELSYVIVGEGTNTAYLARLHQLAEQSGVHVIWTGSVPQHEVRTLMYSAAIFCMPGQPHPHKVEGFGLVYLEAAAQGLPSIASRLAAIPEVVLDGKTGILVPPLDVEALREAIQGLLLVPSYRDELSQAAYQWAKTFSWARCAALSYDF